MIKLIKRTIGLILISPILLGMSLGMRCDLFQQCDPTLVNAFTGLIITTLFVGSILGFIRLLIWLFTDL